MTVLVTRCVRCRQQGCICAQIPQVIARTQFVILRHYFENSRVSNTAHFARLALGSPIYEYGARERFDESQLPLGDDTWLLFPDGRSSIPTTPPQHVIVLDGSWGQARRMRQRIKSIRGLPTLTLPPPDAARPRLRRPTVPYGMSTLEAIAQVVGRFEGAEIAAPLERLHDVVVSARVGRVH